jgi:predicted flap endonuclease-1-like 5' DNA nuclease
MTKTDQGMFNCRNISWIVGALLGLVLLLLIGGGLWGLILGIALAVAVAIGMQKFFCAGADAVETHVDIPVAEEKAGEMADEAKAADAKASAKTGSAEAAAAGGVDAATRTTPAAALGAGSVVATPQPEAASKPKAAPKPKAKAAPTESAGEGTRPEGLDAPRGGSADDLKLIKGVGPKLEALLHELGYYHYDQIANWTKAEVAWVDKNLKGFKGRVSRDGWVDQARALASGEETEFSKRASGSGMYDE